MASGKSTIGRILARRLGYRFVDTDREIAVRTGLTIEKIFSRHGESHFRYLESKLLTELARAEKVVVSLGGGAVLAAANRRLLKSGRWVYLDVPFAVLQNRLTRNPSGRPLAKKGLGVLQDLYRRRQPYYRQADYIIHCGTDRPDFICERVLSGL